MVQSKAITIISSLNRKEIQLFCKFLESTAFTSNKKLSKLLNYIKKFHPDFSGSKITKENVFRSVYGNAVYNDSKTRKLLSDLYKEAEKFLVLKGALSEKDVYNKILLKEFDRRKLDTLFVSQYEKYNSFLDNNKKNSDYFLEKFITEWRNILFYMERGMQNKITQNIYKRIEYLIFFFICDLSLSLNDIEAHNISFNTKSELNLAEEFISDLNHSKLFDYIDRNDFRHKDIVYIYYLGYLSSKHFDDETHYKTLKSFVLKNFDSFNAYLQRASLIPLINYCVRKVSASDSSQFKQELYDYYGMYIRYNLYNITGKNYIRNDVLLNIFSNYFSIGKSNEIKKIIDENIECIQPSHRKNMTSLAEALLNFERKKFAESLKNTSMIKSNTLLYKDIMKILILKTHFELQNYEIAKELINSYSSYLNDRKDITDVRRQKRMKFLHFYSLLWKHVEGKRVKLSLKEMKEEILKSGKFSESEWLLEKIGELTGKKN